MRRNPSSIFALPAGTGIDRPMGIAALNAILRLPASTRLCENLNFHIKQFVI
jgi:hypothetical protein